MNADEKEAVFGAPKEESMIGGDGGEEDDEKEMVLDFADPFVPFDNLPEEPQRIVTIRAVFVGLCCGALVNASNVYLGLKTGWTFTANLFGVSGY